MGGAFSHLERSIAGHFRLNLYAAIYYIVHALRRIGGNAGIERILNEHRFLARYLEQILPHIPDGLGWRSATTPQPTESI